MRTSSVKELMTNLNTEGIRQCQVRNASIMIEANNFNSTSSLFLDSVDVGKT